SEVGCCPRCNAPWKRDVEYVLEGSFEWESKKYSGTEPQFQHLASNLYAGGFRPGGHNTPITHGWKPTCGCTNVTLDDLIPCTVLDPFGGSGTTGDVARSLGRSTVMIELNPLYAKMIEDRVKM